MTSIPSNLPESPQLDTGLFLDALQSPDRDIPFGMRHRDAATFRSVFELLRVRPGLLPFCARSSNASRRQRWVRRVSHPTASLALALTDRFPQRGYFFVFDAAGAGGC